MNIRYGDTKDIDKGSLAGLFRSVEWEVGNCPHKLQKAIQNSHKVITAWEGNKLVGLMNALVDGTIVAYFPFLLVNPEYQKQGIGKRLVDMMLEEYNNHTTKLLIAHDDTVDFYKKCGFELNQSRVPMRISS